MLQQLSPTAEAARIAALRKLEVLDAPPNPILDQIVKLAASLFDVPIALVSLVDTDRQCFKAAFGLGVTETPRSISFCSHAIASDGDVFEVTDALTDGRFCENPLVLEFPAIRFYAGAPLRTAEGDALGTLCLIDNKPRRLNASEKTLLLSLSALVLLELQRLPERAMSRLVSQSSHELQRKTQVLRLIGDVQADFINAVDGRDTWNRLLNELLSLTGSAYGLIGEARQAADGHLYLYVWSLTDIAWDGPTKLLYERKSAQGFEFHNLKNLFGRVLLTRSAVISNDARNDPRRGGLPHGHPPLERFMGLPIEHDGELIGMVGLANRAEGYSESEQMLLQPLLAVVGQVVVAARLRKQQEQQRYFDPLTGLLNRQALLDQLRQAMKDCEDSANQLSIAFIDLDGFKAVNDLHGHAVGDQVLVALARRLKSLLGANDFLGRIGGDELVAVFPNRHPGDAALINTIVSILVVLGSPVTVGSVTVRLSGSIGIACSLGKADEDAEQLLRQADQAMYVAKSSGKNRYEVFDRGAQTALVEHRSVLERLARALGHGEFCLYYQPKVHLRSGAVIGMEALIRWQHPERGLLAPSEFLGYLAGERLEIDLAKWVLRTVLAQIGHWKASGLKMPVSINVSAGYLLSADFDNDLSRSMWQYPELTPGMLTLEILETSALEDIQRAIHAISVCRRHGITVALDDFGTGYSSLRYLKQLRVQQLKIDRGFVGDMLHDPDDLAILEGVLGIARAFSCDVIAEGVETEAAGKLLLQMGCEYGQGYAIARPMQADAVAAWINGWQPPQSWKHILPAPRHLRGLLHVLSALRGWLREVEPTLTAGHRHPRIPLPEQVLQLLDEDSDNLQYLQKSEYWPTILPSIRALRTLASQTHPLKADSGSTSMATFNTSSAVLCQKLVDILQEVLDQLTTA